MTLSVTLTADLSPVKKVAILFGGQRAAQAVAASLNSVAFDAQRALQDLTRREFSSPVTFTQKAFGVEQAKAGGPAKDVVARVYVRDIQANYFKIQIEGGIRKSGDYATTKGGPLIPGGSIQLTESGNFPFGPRRFLAKKLSVGGRDKRGFIRPLGKGVGGVFARGDNEGIKTISLIAVIKPNVRYKARFHFVETIDKVFQSKFDSYFTQNFIRLQKQTIAK